MSKVCTTLISQNSAKLMSKVANITDLSQNDPFNELTPNMKYFLRMIQCCRAISFNFSMFFFTVFIFSCLRSSFPSNRVKSFVSTEVKPKSFDFKTACTLWRFSKSISRSEIFGRVVTNKRPWNLPPMWYTSFVKSRFHLHPAKQKRCFLFFLQIFGDFRKNNSAWKQT